MLKEKLDKNRDSSTKKKLRNTVFATAITVALLTGANSCESNNGEETNKRTDNIELFGGADVLIEDERIEYDKLNERLNELGQKAGRYLSSRADIGTAADLSMKYNIPIVFPRIDGGRIASLDIINCSDKDSETIVIYPFHGTLTSDYAKRPELSKNSGIGVDYRSKSYESYKLSVDEYKKLLDKVEEKLKKEDEVIGNKVNGIIDGL